MEKVRGLVVNVPFYQAYMQDKAIKTGNVSKKNPVLMKDNKYAIDIFSKASVRKYSAKDNLFLDLINIRLCQEKLEKQLTDMDNLKKSNSEYLDQAKFSEGQKCLSDKLKYECDKYNDSLKEYKKDGKKFFALMGIVHERDGDSHVISDLLTAYSMLEIAYHVHWGSAASRVVPLEDNLANKYNIVYGSKYLADFWDEHKEGYNLSAIRNAIIEPIEQASSGDSYDIDLPKITVDIK